MEEVARTALTAVLPLEDENNDGRATVLGLSGELGAGKTTFVQSLARVLGITESVTSPTFVVARFYPIVRHPQFTQMVHIDAYRIEDESELVPIGWEKIISEPKNLVVVEWYEKIASAFPANARTLQFTVVDETTRKIVETNES